VKYYSPNATQRPYYLGVGQDLSLLKDYIPYVLSDKMIFCAMIAMSSTAANIATSGNRERSPETLKYYQFALSQLRERLATERERPSDAVIITLSSLCGFEVSYPFNDLCGDSAQYPISLGLGDVRKLRWPGHTHSSNQTGCCITRRG